MHNGTLFQRRFPWIAVVGLSVVSTVTTGTGVFRLVSGSLDGSDRSLALLLTVILTAFLQGGLVFALVECGVSRGLRRGRFFALYAVLAAISVTLGYGFWFEKMRAHEYAAEILGGQANRTVGSLLRFEATLAPVSTKLGELAEYSSQQAEREAKIGDTCGYDAGAYRGPRAEQRELDAEMFRSAARHVDTLTARVRASVAAARGIDSVRVSRSAVSKLRGAYEDLEVVQDDPELPLILGRLRARLDMGRTGFRGGFDCPDPRLDALISEVLQAELPTLPAWVEPLDPGDPKAVLSFVIDRAVAAAAALPRRLLPSSRSELQAARIEELRAGPAAAADRAFLKDMIPLGWAALVDFLILVFGLQCRSRAAGGVSNVLAGAMSDRETLRSAIGERLHTYLRLEPQALAAELERRTFERSRKSLVGVPLLTASPRERQLQRALDLLVVGGLVVRKGIYPAWYFPAWWRTGGTERKYCVYEMEPAIRMELLLTLLSLDLGRSADGQAARQEEDAEGVPPRARRPDPAVQWTEAADSA